MNKQQKQAFRNQVSQFVEVSNRKINVIRLNIHNTYQHEFLKFRVCFQLQKAGEHYITEAKLKENKGIPDIINLDRAQIIEIMVSEKPETIKQKTKKYPKNFEIIAVNSFDDYIDGNYKIINQL